MPSKVSPGQSYLSNPLVRDSATANGLIDVLDHYRRTELGNGGTPNKGGALSPCEIKIRAPADLDAGSIVEIGEYYLDEMDAANLWFQGVSSSSSTDHFCITRFAAKEDSLVKAIVDGCCMARVNVSSTSHRYAIPGSGTLSSAAAGPMWIMTTPAETGVQLLPVRFAASMQIKIAVLDGDLAHGGSATASVYTASAGTESDSGENVTVYDFDMIGTGKKIASGTKVFIGNVNGYWYVIASAACPTTA